MKWLNGKKTYVGMIVGGLLGFLQQMGWISVEAAAPYWPLLAAWTGVAVKHSYSKGKEGK